jgi:hypothetical protein
MVTIDSRQCVRWDFSCNRQGHRSGLWGHWADFVVLGDALIMKIVVRQTVLFGKFYLCYFHLVSTRICCQRAWSAKSACFCERWCYTDGDCVYFCCCIQSSSRAMSRDLGISLWSNAQISSNPSLFIVVLGCRLATELQQRKLQREVYQK